MKRLINLAAAMFIAALFLGCNSVGSIDDDKINNRRCGHEHCVSNAGSPPATLRFAGEFGKA
ncbi:MAG: hypothetical protein FWE44_04060 [Defluviitaleaceae bacterium]|nr:hypothetical protein [Defluviitaleaceae bacterium]